MSGTAVICASVTADNPLSAQVAGSVQRRCRDCGDRVWVAPTGQAVLEFETNAYPLCIPCGLAALISDPDPELAPVTQAQLDEMARHREQQE